MGTTSPELFVALDRSRPRGLRAQVEEGLRAAIRDGRLVPGARLPSSRALAADLGVTRGVVVDAYDQLAAEGYVTTLVGSGTVVNDVAALEGPTRGAGPGGPAGVAGPAGADAPSGPPLTHDFRAGLPDLALFPRAAWLRATKAALAAMPDAELGYVAPAGLPRLRAAVAAYLGRVRGVACTPDNVIVTNGFAHGFSLVTRALVDRGHGDVAVEVPGYADPRAQVAFAGGRVHHVPVDDEGIRVDRLAATGATVVVVTPAHQAPTGVVMSPARRRELVEWARTTPGYVIEDDYDAEYRYDRQPVGAVQGVAPERVVYHGTLSKSLAPGLRLGWLVVPDDLVDEVARARRLVDHMTASVVQATFAEFLERGDLDRHLRRCRLVYKERRDALVGALDEFLPGWEVGGVSAGLQAFVTLPAGWDSGGVIRRGRAAGIGVHQVDDPAMSPEHLARTLLLGYGTQRPDQLRTGLRRLAAALGGEGPG